MPCIQGPVQSSDYNSGSVTGFVLDTAEQPEQEQQAGVTSELTGIQCQNHVLCPTLLGLF